MGARCIFNSIDRAAQGVGILFSNNFQFDIIYILKDLHGRYISVHIKNPVLEDLVLVNVYGPNSDDSYFYQSLFTDIEPFSDKPIVIGGDFMICLTENDKEGGRPYSLSHPNTRSILLDAIDEYDMVDIWRVLNPNAKQYTWRQRNISVKCRLDFFLMSLYLSNIVKTAEISYGFRTDHSYISVTLGKRPRC